MSADQTYIDRRGASRTRTDTIRVALKILGYNDCYHGFSCIHENPPDNYLWLEAADAKFRGKGEPWTRKEWDSLLGDCAAVSDLPCVAFAPELIEAYPDAKVILTHPPKGFDSWFRSYERTILYMWDDWTRDVWAFFHHESYITRNTFRIIFGDFWGNDFRRNARRVLDQHHAMIRETVSEERLLEYNVIDGWEPLCKFLGKPIPDVPFPAGNDPQDFFRRFARADRRRRREVVARGITTLVCVSGLVFAFRERRRLMELTTSVIGALKSGRWQ
ncbi:P-loop containing nucleoside triphosphate hydrolase protein [Penicillium capsulatum]|uniref:P-loop containing nucleoside triphosphate hydrolase protein n=1 Tax=Penicillium capsulatum TaxID=69766 RepID=A0A9W9LKU1_9EURO|nr:P-loop containing nucleoside triphosphate hydrolase protein [Penicillium capsulatum]KAJ6116780.1 P-loop containing nucleoside triphosphate hydrolase protein [Penicillium capsulatum]